jgi:quercetin dioxygenase-like cupin family protein
MINKKMETGFSDPQEDPLKIIHYSEAEAKKYPSDQAKAAAGRVVIGQSDGAEKFCMRVFEIGPGGMTGWHAHDWEHEVFVHAGQGAVLQGETWIPLSAGSVVFIPGNEAHQLKNTGDRPFVFVCVIPTGAPEL